MPYTDGSRLSTQKALTLIAACISLTTACGLGPAHKPPPPPPASLVSLSTNVLQFGEVTVAHLSPVQVITITSHSDEVLPVAFSAPFIEFGFSITSDCGSEIPPHATCSIKAAFNPQRVGGYNASFYLKFRQYGEIPVRLRGTAIAKP